MAWKALIGGDDLTTSILQPSGVDITGPLNERATARFTLKHGVSVDAFDVVELYDTDGATVRFGGLVYTRKLTSVGHYTMMTVEAVDYSIYADWRYITVSYLAEVGTTPNVVSMKTALTAIVAAMADLGVTLEGSQVAGPDLDEFAWDNVRCSDALRELSDKTGYAVQWGKTSTKTLRMWPPSDTSELPAVQLDTTAITLDWAESLENYATRVKLLCGPDGTGETWQSWTGDGTMHSWTTTMRAVVPDPTRVQIATITPPSVTWKTVTTRRAFNILSSSASPTAVAINASSVAAQTEIWFGAAHLLEAGDTFVIAGHAGSTPDLNGTHVVVSKVSSTRVTIAVTVSVAGTGGTGRHKITTITTTVDHNFIAGDLVKLTGHTSTPNMNGTQRAVQAVTANTFTLIELVTAAGGRTGTVSESKADYLWVKATHTLSVDEGTIPTANEIVTLYFNAKFPFLITADSAASPIIDYCTTAPGAMTIGEGKAIADTLLTAMYQRPITVTWTQPSAGWDWLPGQQREVLSTIQGLALTVLVTSLDAFLHTDSYWVYRITGTGLSGALPAYQGSSLDYFRRLGGGSSTSMVRGSGAGPTLSMDVPTEPDKIANDWTVDGLMTVSGEGVRAPAYSTDYGEWQIAKTASTNYGTAGTLTGVTADTTSGDTAIALSVDHGISNGEYVTIGSMAGAFVLSGVGATSATLSRAATATLTGATVQYIQLPDPEVFWGYNLNRLSKASEPEFGWKLEANYLDVLGYTRMENYLQYQGAVSVRPFRVGFNKTTELIADVDINGGYNGFRVYGGIGDGSDSGLFIARMVGGYPRMTIGDWSVRPAAIVERTLTVLDNDTTSIAAATLNDAKALVQIAASNGGGTPYAQLYGYRYDSGGPIPLYINQYGGNVSIGGTAERSGTAGTGRVDIFDGTAPTGTLANGCSLYSTAGEMRVMDAAGNATLLSPHDEQNKWVFRSKNTVTGECLHIDMEDLVDALEQVTGRKFSKRWIEPVKK